MALGPDRVFIAADLTPLEMSEESVNGPAPWWGRCSGQPCSHAALSTACLLHGAVFTEFSQKDSFRINLIE